MIGACQFVFKVKVLIVGKLRENKCVVKVFKENGLNPGVTP